ncbi:hypothetical protein [Polyangium jinanense]|uniref:ATPase PglY C-terminal domain-containing protein n=1 Tax=Polyangium jinanense TaxID=2829994 RepID=A0A9X3X2T1_9BACT|nr:hypothetical protein [Polyangium jinanense]MDC3952707.1 hypothetical protein [Polyangium jinanense]MDC3980326.1 hypothetical protein [Polyangium jinanense]
MAKSRTGIDSSAGSLPEPTTWARAVVLGTGILGVSLTERTLSAKALEELGRKVLEVVRAIQPAARKLVEVLEARTTELGIDHDCDRLRTARSARALCEAIAGKSLREAREIVEALAAARLETSSSAVQASLGAADDSLETLDDPLVLGVLKQLAGREKGDLSASKYLREARSILRQDEMRRSLSVELRMVAGAAQAYLLSGTPSAEGAAAHGPADDGGLPKSVVLASVVAPADVRIEASRAAPTPPPSATRARSGGTKRISLTQTLASEGTLPFTRVSVERRGSTPDRKTARALLAEAVREAEQKLEASPKGPALLSVLITLDISDKGA